MQMAGRHHQTGIKNHLGLFIYSEDQPNQPDLAKSAKWFFFTGIGFFTGKKTHAHMVKYMVDGRILNIWSTSI